MSERVFDYSTISSFQTCRKKYYFEHVRNLKPKIKGAALTFGQAVHEGLEQWYKMKALNPALDAFKACYEDREGEEVRTVENGCKLLTEYTKKYEVEPFTPIDKSEEGFIFPLSNGLYGGRLDLPVLWDGQMWIMEHKTTTRLSGSYFDQFSLDKQVTGYIIGLEELYGERCMGCIINAMEPWKEVKRVTEKTKKAEDHFLRKPVTRSQMLKDRFKLNVERIIRDIKWCEENNEYQEAEKKEVCLYYNRKCPYHDLCCYGEDPRLLSEYVIEEWKPFEIMEEIE